MPGTRPVYAAKFTLRMYYTLVSMHILQDPRYDCLLSGQSILLLSKLSFLEFFPCLFFQTLLLPDLDVLVAYV